jgi:FkbM family methyltransferase
MHLSDGDIWFAEEGINGDRGTFGEVFVAQCYRSNYRDATVVDIGGHKGYFGAYALLHGAKTILSYEPEEKNFAALERAAESFRAGGHEWRIARVAVGSFEREADLKVSRNSWSHSLFRVLDREETGRVQKVRVISLSNTLDEAETLDERIIVKIDVEGSECEIVLGTPIGSWATVNELFVEIHAFAPCSTNEGAEHVAMRVERVDEPLHLIRPGSEPEHT